METKEETIIEVGAKVMRQVKVRAQEPWMLSASGLRCNKHCAMNFWYLMIPCAKWFCRASRTKCKESAVLGSLKMFCHIPWIAHEITTSFPSYFRCNKKQYYEFHFKIPVRGKCHIVSRKGSEHLSGIQYWHQCILKYKENVPSDNTFCHTTM